MGKPRDISMAIVAAASAQPGTVRQLAARAAVGMRNARYTCGRLVALGELVVLKDCRPMVRCTPDEPERFDSAAAVLAAVFGAWQR